MLCKLFLPPGGMLISVKILSSGTRIWTLGSGEVLLITKGTLEC